MGTIAAETDGALDKLIGDNTLVGETVAITEPGEQTAQVLNEADLMEAEANIDASAKLRVLFASYHSLKKSRPKFPSEKDVLFGLAYHGPDWVNAKMDECVVAFKDWVVKMQNLLDTINEIGETFPSASIAIIGHRSASVIQVNGVRLADALIRTEDEILRGSLGT